MTLQVKPGDQLEYASKQPVLVVQHQVNSETLRELLRQWAAARGVDSTMQLVAEALSCPKEGNYGYMVSVDGMGAPSHVHTNAAIATGEANRLANKHPNNKVRVLKVVSVRVAVQDTRVEVLNA